MIDAEVIRELLQADRTIRTVEVGSTDFALPADDRIAITRAARRPLQAGQVRVGMLYMTVNPADLLQMSGRYGRQPALPFVPGHEGSAVVLETAPDVDELQVGTLVVPLGASGYWSDERVLAARQVVTLPGAVDPQQAAMLVANPATASVLLQQMSRLQAGDWVIQNAANSAVGQSVRRQAARQGLRLVNVVRRAGAIARDARPDEHWVVDAEPGVPSLLSRLEPTLQGQRPRLALDALGGRASGALAASLGEGGTLIVYGLMTGEPAAIDVHDLVFRGIRVQGFWLARWFAEPQNRSLIPPMLAELVERLGRGELHIDVEASHDLEQVVGALEQAAREGRHGKVLLSGVWMKRLGSRLKPPKKP